MQQYVPILSLTPFPWKGEGEKNLSKTQEAQTCYFSSFENKRSFQLDSFVPETINLGFIKANTWVISSIQEEY